MSPEKHTLADNHTESKLFLTVF